MSKVDFMHCLAEGDKEGMMINKMLDELWKLAKEDDDVTRCCYALNAHVKLLQQYCTRVKKWKVKKEEKALVGACWILT